MVTRRRYKCYLLSTGYQAITPFSAAKELTQEPP